jgi:predicted ATPase
MDPELKKELELALASQGSKQVLALITQLCWEQKGDILMVEEPEICLHPENQLILQELFGEIASEGKQIICTTHSPLFILALSKVVKNGILSQKDIKILHTQKTEKGTKFTPLPLTKDGYVKGWIPSFAGAEDKLLKEWGETIGD